MRIRWALKEVGQPYAVRSVSFAAMKEAAHRRLHPFGQIPTSEDGEVTLFESARSCFTSRLAMQACFQRMRARERAINWMSPRSARWSR